MRLIILAAGTGNRLKPLTETRPKCLVEVAGKPLLEWQLAAATAAGIDDITIIGGHFADQLRRFDAELIVNPNYASTNMVTTLFCARERFGDGFLLSYGDIAYSPDHLRALCSSAAPISVVVDRGWRDYWEQRFTDVLDDAESLRLDDAGRILEIGQRAARVEEIQGQYIGLMSFRDEGVAQLRSAFATAQDAAGRGRHPFDGPRPLERMYMTDLLQGMITQGHAVTALPVDGGWLEIDSLRDRDLAEELIRRGRLQ